MNLTLSIILPTHDRPDSLSRTVESILGQGRVPEQLIIVSDTPTPIDTDIKAQVEASGVRFEFLQQEKPSASASRNLGMSVADGDIVAFFDDDVTLADDYLENLMRFYESDADVVIGGVGGQVIEQQKRTIINRIWDYLAEAFARSSFAPRVRSARYVELPRQLQGKLKPTKRLSGAAISVRRSIGKEVRFEESFGGYSLAEDMEFCFRVGRENALFVSPELKIYHDASQTHRPDMMQFGKSYVANLIHIANKSMGRGAGTVAVLGYHFAGMIVLYSLWSLFSLKIDNAKFAAGMICELIATLARKIGGLFCVS